MTEPTKSELMSFFNGVFQEIADVCKDDVNLTIGTPAVLVPYQSLLSVRSGLQDCLTKLDELIRCVETKSPSGLAINARDDGGEHIDLDKDMS